MAESDLDLVYVGNDKDIVMYEGAAKEITEPISTPRSNTRRKSSSPSSSRRKNWLRGRAKKSAKSS